MRYVRLWSIAFLVCVASFLGLTDRAFASPIDLLENQNEMMGTLSKTNWFEDQSTLPRYMNTFWTYTSDYSEEGQSSGSSSGTSVYPTYTYETTNAQHQITVPKLTFTAGKYSTSQYEGTIQVNPGSSGSIGSDTFLWMHLPNYTMATANLTEKSYKSTTVIPAVTVANSETFQAQDTRVGVNYPWMFKYKLDGFTSSQEDVYAVMSFAGISKGGMGTGVAVNKGDIIKPVINPKPVRYDDHYTNRWLYDVRYFGYWGSDYHEIEISSDGTLRIPHDSSYLVMVFRINQVSIPSGSQYLYVNKPSLLLYNDFGLDKLSNELHGDITTQTQNLISTNGYSDIADNALEQSESITSKLGFVSQSVEISKNLIEALNYEGDSYVTFPQIAWEGTVIIPETNVPILGWLPQIEDDVKTGVTLMFFLAWLHGMHSLYARIFLGQVETISEDE